MDYRPIDFSQKFSLFSEQWSPKGIARLDGYAFKIAKIEGDFVWHKHADADEVFIVHRGTVRIEFRDGEVTLSEGQMFVVPAGIEHRPHADQEAQIIMVEREGVRNTGEINNEHTVDEIDWI